jgi:uncharacterized protein with PIN domain
MSLITDLVSLAKQLDTSISDRKQRELLLPVKEKLLDVEREQFQLETRHAKEIERLQSEHAKVVADLQSKIQSIQSRKTRPADPCPYCRADAGECLRIEPHRIFGEAGVKNAFYKCSECGKEYDKELKH